MRSLATMLLTAFTAASCYGQAPSVAAPADGKLYHGVYPGGQTGEEDDIAPADVTAYEDLAGKHVAWVYVSNNWYRSRAFPLETAQWTRDHGSIPFIRLMLRSSSAQNKRERLFNVRNILRGRFDADLRAWAAQARDFGSPLLVEWGTECNGAWFSWNGKWNGGKSTRGFGDKTKPDGPERFVAAYRHIVEVMRGAGAANITWVWHVNATDGPQVPWNASELYYPGNDVVDWVAVSVYGPQTPLDEGAPTFREQMDPCYARLDSLAPGKPVMLAEFGCTAGNPLVAPENWARAALSDILGGRYPRLAGFSWWNERWENDDNPAHNTTMCLEDIPALADVFKTMLENSKAIIVERPSP
ncbi:MAG: glycosyl hydrolase [Planctomycetota bacterium]|nr:glycosyl hydrolase [Planctomycetota bacterium]